MTPIQIDSVLKDLWAEVNGMPWVAERWPDFNEDEREVYWFEWPDLLARFEGLIEAAAGGKLNAQQYERYEQLVHRYAEVLPIVKRLDLETIPAPKVFSRH